MNIVKKEWVYQPFEIPELAKTELTEYEFDGRIDFSFGPIFCYDVNNHITIDYGNDKYKATKVLINDEVVDLKKITIKSVSVERIRFTRSYSLQDFFNEHKNAKCIVFFLYGPSIFHEAYTIRVYIDEEGYTTKQEEVELQELIMTKK